MSTRRSAARGVGEAMVGLALLLGAAGQAWPAGPAGPAGHDAPSRAAAPQRPFEQVVKELASPDANARRAAMRLLGEAGYPEAIGPLAALVVDPVDDLQLEAIDTELALSFGRRFSTKKRVAGFIEVRNRATAQAAFDGGAEIPAHAAPAELVKALIGAMRDEGAGVRLEALYAFGSLVPPDADLLDQALAQQAVEALTASLGETDPALRLAGARVAARLFLACGPACLPSSPRPAGDAFILALNDPEPGVRVAAMQALGALRDVRAVQALTDHHAFYREGREAEAALDALARIAHPSSSPLFWKMVAHRAPLMRRFAIEGIARLDERAKVEALDEATHREAHDAPAAAAAFALHRLGRGPRVDRLLEFLQRPATREQVRGYVLELGPSLAPALAPHLADPNALVRTLVADVLGRLGNPAAADALKLRLQDGDPGVVVAARRALLRLQRRTTT